MRRSDKLGLIAVGFTRREALQRSAIAVGSLALCGILPSRGGAASVGSGREVIRDPHFQRGFTALDPKPGKRVSYGVLPGHVRGEKPVWDLAQWSSKHPLQLEPPQPLASRALRYSNSAKAVTLGQPDTDDADLSLRVNASVEYGRRARRDGEPWVHLLLQQDIENPPALADLSAAQLHVEARLKSSKRIDAADYSPSRHAAQFQIFFSVQNLNRQSPGYGQYLWFGIPIYDDRDRFPKAHKAQDAGGTSMFIFTSAGDVFTKQSAHDRQWLVIDKDLLPLMREGLETAWQRGFLKDSRLLADYRIAGMNLGWELPGIFDVELQVRNISLKVTAKA
jgi:hypothetical protein